MTSDSMYITNSTGVLQVQNRHNNAIEIKGHLEKLKFLRFPKPERKRFSRQKYYKEINFFVQFYKITKKNSKFV